MNKYIKKIQNPDILLRDRMFQLLSVIALAEFIFVSAYTIVSGGGTGHIIIMIIGTIMFAVTVSFTFKSKRMRLGAAISGLLYFAMYPLTFFSSGGMYGGAPVVFTFALVYVFLVTQKWERILALGICVITSAVCYAVSYLHPEMLTRHDVLEENIESILAILLATFLLSTLFAFVTGVYMTENKIVQKQKKEIEDLNQSQKRFFSSMSHEIRTPVNAIIGLNEMTLREDISDEVRENSQNIEIASRILLHTVNEILDMSRLETGSIQIIREKYNTTDMFSDIVNMIWLRAKEKGLEFIVEADPKLPSALYGDEVRIKQILLNVITNAVKYTKKGSVTLKISCTKHEKTDPSSSASFVMIYDVIDTGIGIKEENIPHLFTAFGRFDENKNHAIEGTGLGLFIVKQLLDIMNGEVNVISEYGKGSTFHIEIPQEISDQKPIGKVDVRKYERTLESDIFTKDRFADSSIKILAVDDTPMNLMVVKKLLRDASVTLDTAESGAEALEKTAVSYYDVIFMDHQMPEMDGIECLHRIREQENGLCKGSKIVCLTANVGSDMDMMYMQEGFDGYLVKPVRGKMLEDEIARLINN